MTPLAVQLCVGCGQVLDEPEPPDGRPCWIVAEVYHEKYGVRCVDLNLSEAACPFCARVLTIGPPELLLKNTI